MFDENRALKQLEDLDNEIIDITQKQASDSKVSFEYFIKRLGPTDKYWQVILSIKSVRGFDLNKIDKVIYLLHPTFDPNKIAVSDSSDGFRLEIMAWGDFHAMAIVVYKDGAISQLVQFLPIGIPDEEIAS